MSPSASELIASLCFALALIHTFSTSFLKRLANRYRSGSIPENIFHLLGEVEIVFGFWAAVMLMALVPFLGLSESLKYLESRHFAEAIFVFVVMTIAASSPILSLARFLIVGISKGLVFLPRHDRIYFSMLTLGPLLGSFITEPAAMTVTAFLLKELFFDRKVSAHFKYISIGVLFVNTSVGGVLTPYAAPPVLMVAGKWGWDLSFMMTQFGWKAAFICVFNAIFALFLLRKELHSMSISPIKKILDRSPSPDRPPLWLISIHLLFLIGLVLVHDRITLVFGFLLFFLGIATATKEYQKKLHLRESLLVGFFLGGLVILGGLQAWWLEPLLNSLSSAQTYVGAIFLTAITDNAALTYLGAQVPDIGEVFKYALVAGAVTGGGLTVVANAPNPAGFSILQSSFGKNGIQHGQLFLGAIIPTLIATFIFWFL